MAGFRRSSNRAAGADILRYGGRLPLISRIRARAFGPLNPASENVSLYLPFNGFVGSEAVVDESLNAFAITSHSSNRPKLSVVAPTKWGNYGRFFLNGWLSVAGSPKFSFPGDLSIQVWYRAYEMPKYDSETLIEIGDANTDGLRIRVNVENGGGGGNTEGQGVVVNGVALGDITPFLTPVTRGLYSPDWDYISLIRDGDIVEVAVNGTPRLSGTVTGTINAAEAGVLIGQSFDTVFDEWMDQGSLDDLRVVKGEALSHAVPTAAFPTPVIDYSTSRLALLFEGADNSTTFLDSGANAVDITAHNGAEITTATAGQGTSSGRFMRASGSYLSFPEETALNVGTGDFRITFRARFAFLPTSGQTFTVLRSISAFNSTAPSIQFSNSDGGLRLQAARPWAGVVNQSSILTAAVDTWYRFEASRVGDTITFKQNDTAVGTATDAANYNFGSEGTNVGGNGASGNFNGWLDALVFD